MTQYSPRQVKQAREYLDNMSDEKLMKLIEEMAALDHKILENAMVDGRGLEIPEFAKIKLRQLKKTDVELKSSGDNKWVTYMEQLVKLKVKMPRVYTEMTDRQMYKKLSEECRGKLLPDDFADFIVPHLMQYVKTGRMQPILLAGEPGCGKTMAAKLVAELMSLNYTLYSVPDECSNSPLNGTPSVYVGSDAGAYIQGFLLNQCLNYVMIVDEVEKDSKGMSRSSVQENLLSLCDGNADHFKEHFMGFDIDVSACPIIMTCNDLAAVSAPLKDRVAIYRFPEVEKERMVKIISFYGKEAMKKKGDQILSLDSDVLDHAVCSLYDHNVHSIRQHQKMVDAVLNQVYIRAMRSDSEERLAVGKEDFDREIDRILVSGSSKMPLGFHG